MKHYDPYRVEALIRALDELTQDVEGVGDIGDINEIMGLYDGRIMAIRETWQELKVLFGLEDTSDQN